MENRTAMWAVALPLILFKLWGAILLMVYAPNSQTFNLILGTHWPWALALGVMVAAPLLAWWRLVRVRTRRERLRRAEWMMDEGPARQADLSQWPRWDTVSWSDAGGPERER